MIDFLKKKGYSFKDLYFIIKNFIYYWDKNCLDYFFWQASILLFFP